jgi:hypothetical protein
MGSVPEEGALLTVSRNIAANTQHLRNRRTLSRQSSPAPCVIRGASHLAFELFLGPITVARVVTLRTSVLVFLVLGFFVLVFAAE